MPVFNFFGNEFDLQETVRNMVLGGMVACLPVTSLKNTFQKYGSTTNLMGKALICHERTK